MVQNLRIHIYYTVGVVLTFANNNESISLPPELPLTPERIKLRRDTGDKDALFSNNIADVSLNSKGTESESAQDHGIARNPNLCLESSLASKTEVKPGDRLNGWKVPSKTSDFRFDHCQFLCKNTSAGLASKSGIHSNCDAQMSLLNQSLESEVRLQSLPLQTVNFTNHDESVKETKHKEIQKRDKIKQYLKTKRNEIVGKGQEKVKYKQEVELALSNTNHQGKVSDEYSLPRPNIAIGRETETRNTAEKHETATPLQQSNLSNTSITSKNITTDINSAIMTNMNFQTTASKKPCKFEMKNEEQIALGPDEQIALSPKDNVHNLEGTLFHSMTASHPSQMSATSRNTTINETHTKDKSYSVLQRKYVDFSGTTPKANRKQDKMGKTNSIDTFALSNHQYKEDMIQTNLLKAENARQGETSSHRGDNGHLSIGKTRKPREDRRLECGGNGINDLTCTSIGDKNGLKDDAHYHKEKSTRGIGKISKGEKKVKEVFPKVIMEDNESEYTEENLEKLRQINKTLKESKLCKVCRDKDANRLFLPCAHLACCSLCSPAVRNCPQCKGNIRGIVSVYFG